MADKQTPASPPPNAPDPAPTEPVELPTAPDPGLIRVKEFSEDERWLPHEEHSGA